MPTTITGMAKTETEQVRIPVEVLKDARIVCVAGGESLPALATRALQELIERELPDAADTINKRVKQRKRKPDTTSD